MSFATIKGAGCFLNETITNLNNNFADCAALDAATNSLTGNLAVAGTLAITGASAFTGVQTQGGAVLTLTAITANGAIAPHTPANYIITKAGIAAMTLAAPTATTDDGVLIYIASGTANAHTVTATGLYLTGTSAVNLATYAGIAGAAMLLMAYQAKWIVMWANAGITLS